MTFRNKEIPHLWLVIKKEKKFWFYYGDPFCENCRKETFTGYYLSNWSKNNLYHKFVCGECRKQIEKTLIGVQEQKFCLVTAEIPENGIPANPTYPGLTSATNMTTFEAATKTIGQERIEDKTKLAGKAKQVEMEYIGKPLELLEKEKK